MYVRQRELSTEQTGAGAAEEAKLKFKLLRQLKAETAKNASHVETALIPPHLDRGCCGHDTCPLSFALVRVKGRRASTVVMGEDPLAKILGEKVTGLDRVFVSFYRKGNILLCTPPIRQCIPVIPRSGARVVPSFRAIRK